MMLDAKQVRELLRAADYHRVAYPPRAPSGALMLRVRATLRAAGLDGLRASEVARAVERPTPQVATVLGRLCVAGYVAKIDCRYVFVDPAAQAQQVKCA